MFRINSIAYALFLSFGLNLVHVSAPLASFLPEDQHTQPKPLLSLYEKSLDFIILNINTDTILSQLNDPGYFVLSTVVMTRLKQDKLVELSEQMQVTQADEFATLKALIHESWSKREYKIVSDERIASACWDEYAKLSITEKGEVDLLTEIKRITSENRESAIQRVLNLDFPLVSFRGVYLNEHELWRISLKSKGLRLLDISHSKISDKELGLDCCTWSTYCTNLQNLDVSSTMIKFMNPTARPLTSVLDLSARANWIQRDSIKNMVSIFPNLRKLDLSESEGLCVNTDFLTLLRPLTCLMELSIANCKLTDFHLQHITALTSLAKIDFSGNNEIDPNAAIPYVLTLPILMYVNWGDGWYQCKTTSNKK